jgi:hypothetical protein
MDERRLPGGKTDGAVLVDGTVRRAVGPWTPAVHALLQHLASAGFDESPRVLGSDDDGREALTYIPGETLGALPHTPAWAWDEATLIDIGELLRRYHDAVADFVPPPNAAWRLGGGPLGPGEIICHNDVGPYNVVWRERIVRLLDWDFAGPAEPVWDLAYTAWTFVPLHYPELARSAGAPDLAEAPRRLRLLLDAYRLDERGTFLDVVLACVEARASVFALRADEGDPGMLRLMAAGHASDMARTESHIRRNLRFLQGAVE